MLETAATFHEPMSALKLDAPANIPSMLVTEAVFQLAKFTLNVDAPENIEAIVETDTTFHFETSAVNVGREANSDAMLETAPTFQSLIGPPFSVDVAAGSVVHFCTTGRMVSSVMQVTQSDPTVHA
jgi:hypothetical protein